MSALCNSLPAFGFLTVVEDEQHGFFGGYLVLSELGRPLEFHCSTPVLPSKAQRILYGRTLRSFVLGELIGQTLVQKTQLPVQVLLTDLEEMLGVGLFWRGDLAWVSRCREPVPNDLTQSSSAPTTPERPSLAVDDYQLTGSSTCCWSPAALNEVLTPLVSYVDLAEPFERIREAIQEAQRATEHSAAEVNDHSAAA